MQINTKSKAIQIINYVLFLGIGVGLLYLAFRKQNFGEILKAIQSANLWWIVPVFLANFIGGIVRALRWQMLIRPLGFLPSLFNTFNSMMFGYFVNYAVPRLGEITRCMTLNKKERIPVTSLFGTVMVERIADLILLALSICAAFILRFDIIASFFKKSIFGPIYHLIDEKILQKPLVMGLIILIIGFLIYYLIKANNKLEKDESGEDKIDKLVNEVWIGLMSVFKMKDVGWFVVYSLLIWAMYLCTSYFWLLAFSETSSFDLSVALVIMVIGTLGRSVPIQGGGMGAYHYLVAKGLLLFGVGEVVGNAYAIVNHGSSMIFQLILGCLCGLGLLLTKNKEHYKESV